MSERKGGNNVTANSQASYVNSWEHLADELRLLDLRINLRMARRRRVQGQKALDTLKGLVISDEEIDGLLNAESDPFSTDPLVISDSPEAAVIAREMAELEGSIEGRQSASIRENVYLSFPHLCRMFNLTTFEGRCLLVCLATELDRKYEKIYAYLHDDVTRKQPSVDLALQLLCGTATEKLSARLIFDPQSPLIKFCLLSFVDNIAGGQGPLISRSLKIDDRIVGFLLESRQVDARIQPCIRLVYPQSDDTHATVTEEARGRVRDFLRSHFVEKRTTSQKLVMSLYGPRKAGKVSLARSLCYELGVPLLIADVEKMVGLRLPFDDLSLVLGREAILQQSALCLKNVDCLLEEGDKYQSLMRSLIDALNTFSSLTFLIGRRPWRPAGLFDQQMFIAIEFPTPDERERKRIWETCLKRRCEHVEDIDVCELASKFRLTPGQIDDAIREAKNLALWRSPEEGHITMEDLHAACRTQSHSRLDTLARKITPKLLWNDIILPSLNKSQLREICTHVKYRYLVYGEWGFDRKLSLGKGLNVLFSGPSGTGKTMAAEIIAHELGLDLYKIDLSQVVSKYIGETEKNLDKIFNEAQTSNAILFFDEADALFGKRSEVKDAHDRYANIEIGYLLQKMEEYHGVAILATNLRQNMDEAFVRRIQVIVEFPFPDEEHRRRIWEVTFPQEAPIGDEVDFGVLAREIKLAGGNIKNIALTAAFYAAEESGVVMMVHLVRAVRREYQKLGRPWNEIEWGAKGKPAPH